VVDKKLLYTLLTFTAIITVAYLIIFLLSPFLGAIVWACVLSMTAYPLHRKFLKIFKGRKNISAFLSTAVVFIIIAVPFFLLAIIFTAQAFEVLSYLEDAINKGNLPVLQQIQSNPSISNMVEKIKPYLGKEDLHAIGISLLKGIWSILAFASKKFAVNIFSGFFQFFMTILLLFFAFRDGETIIKTFWEIVPLKESDVKKVENIFKRIIKAVLYGIVLACIVQGILGGVGFAIAGLPAPVFYGAIMTLAAFIAVIGAALIWIPAVVYLYATGNFGSATFLMIWCLTVVSMIDNLIRPLYISGKSKISLPIVVIGVLGGLITLGFLGIILGPLMLSLFVEALRIYKEEVIFKKENEQLDT
ncbi:MAG: AI-2E family transporter, partial [Acidobacteria bacterium]|nr:AI-2E family transporter [Acidobacteriota bacterium]